MTAKLKLLTDWGKLNHLIKEGGQEKGPAPIKLQTLEQKLLLRFPNQNDELKAFCAGLQNKMENAPRGALHLLCKLQNSYFASEFLSILQEEFKGHNADSYQIHCEKLKIGESLIGYLNEIKHSVPLRASPFRVVYLSGVEKLAASQWNELKEYFASSPTQNKHFYFYISKQNENSTGDTLAPIPFEFSLELHFKKFTEEALAQAIVENICGLSKIYQLDIEYIEPEVVLHIYKDIQKASIGGHLPLKEVVNDYCLEAFLRAQQNGDTRLKVSLSWLGDILIEKIAA